MDQDRAMRVGVGAVITDRVGNVAVFERSDIPGAFQFPQGGIKKGEELLDAAFREVYEETGIRRESLTLITEYPDWLAYELPPDARTSKTGRGQVQKWYLFALTGPVPLDGPSSEFMSHRWQPFETVVNQCAAFRRPLYRRLCDHFGEHVGPVEMA